MDFHAALARDYPELATKLVFLTGGAFTLRAREFLERVENQRLEKPIDVHGLKALVDHMLR